LKSSNTSTSQHQQYTDDRSSITYLDKIKQIEQIFTYGNNYYSISNENEAKSMDMHRFGRILLESNLGLRAFFGRLLF